MARGPTIPSGLPWAAHIVVLAAPSLLGRRPANLPIHHAHIASIGQAGGHCPTTPSSPSHYPGPEAIHLDVFPHHARAWVNAWRAVALTALTTVAAAPLLLGRRPSPEEVVQSGIALGVAKLPQNPPNPLRLRMKFMLFNLKEFIKKDSLMLKHIMTVCAPCIINHHPELLCSTSQHKLDLELFEVISVILW